MSAETAASSVSTPIDSALGQMLRGDPLARWLARWRIAPLGFGLIVLAYGFTHALLLPFFFGHLRTATGVVGVLDDWPYLVLMLVVVPLRFLAFYTVAFILVRQVVTLISLNRFFAGFTVEIAPLHPDRAGGLRVLGDYVLSGAFLLAIVGLNFGMTLLRGQANPEVLTTEFYFELVYYLLAIPVIFILPLWTVHTQMAAAQRKLLFEVAEQFDQEYRTLLDNLRRNKLDPGDVARVEAVQKIYQIAQAAPVWPFDLETLSEFGAAVFLPIFAPVGVDLLADPLGK